MSKKGLVVCFTALMLSVVTACSSSEPKSSSIKEASPSVESSVSEEYSAVESAAEVEPEKAEAEALNVGDSFERWDWKITVTDFSFGDSIQNGDFMKFTPEDGNKFAIINISISNTGKESNTFLPSFNIGSSVGAKLLYGDGYEFTATVLLGFSDDLHNASLNPLTEKNGVVVFDIPVIVSDSSDELYIEFYQGSDSMKYQLK